MIARVFTRHLQSLLTEELRFSPAVALLGPRQVGKTTLAREVARDIPHIYLDLESERDRSKLALKRWMLCGYGVVFRKA
jgi:predicted AAA+ superfamily ATPase